MNFKSIFSFIFLLVVSKSAAQAPVEIPKAVNELIVKHTCFTCHKAEGKLIGPSWKDISARGMKKAEIVAAVYKPDPSRWPGYPPMVGMPQVPAKDIEKIADWIIKLSGKK